MNSPDNYPDRVTPLGENEYCWKHKAGKDYMLDKLKAGFLLFMGVFLVILLFEVYLIRSASNHSLAGIIAIFLVIFLATILLIFGLSALIVSSTVERYRMTNTSIRTGTGAEFTEFRFQSVEKMTVYRNYIRLQKKAEAVRIYTDPGDMSFVQSFIRLRIPEDAEIIYEYDCDSGR